jgi:hypothetical protein
MPDAFPKPPLPQGSPSGVNPFADHYLWLKGVNREFLARLEPWQWNI